MTVGEFYRYCLSVGAADYEVLIYEPCECRQVVMRPCDIKTDPLSRYVVVEADVDNHYEDDEEGEVGVEESTSNYTCSGVLFPRVRMCPRTDGHIFSRQS